MRGPYAVEPKFRSDPEKRRHPAFDVLFRIHRAKTLVDKDKLQLKQAVHDGERRLRRANETIEGLRREVKSAIPYGCERARPVGEGGRGASSTGREVLQVVRAEGSTVRQAGTGSRVGEENYLVGPWITSLPLDLGPEGNTKDAHGRARRSVSQRNSSYLAWITGAFLVLAILYQVLPWIFDPPLEISVGFKKRNEA